MWQPIFNLREGKKIQKKINDIVETLTAVNYKEMDLGLFTGISGISLFFFYLAKLKNSNYFYEFGYKLIEQVIEQISTKRIPTNFVDGLAGIGWTIEHLYKNKFINGNSDFILSELDEHLLAHTNELNKNSQYDLFYGTMGYVSYLLARDKIDIISYKKIIDYFKIESEQISKNEIVWYSSYANKKAINLGLAHGLPSVIIILIKLLTRTNKLIEYKELIYYPINYLLNKKNENYKAIGSLFPAYISEDNEKGSRLAWCYGDMGIGIALLQASLAFNDNELLIESKKIMEFSALRKNLRQNFVIDALICHGSSGIAHMFNRHYNQTKNKTYKESAKYWFQQTIEMGNQKGSSAGYKFLTGNGTWIKDYSLLNGIAGIGLALISAVSDIEPKWDEALLLS